MISKILNAIIFLLVWVLFIMLALIAIGEFR